MLKAPPLKSLDLYIFGLQGMPARGALQKWYMPNKFQTDIVIIGLLTITL